MTVRIITAYEVGLPPEMDGIAEKNFIEFLKWEKDSAELGRRILEKFKPRACALAGFSDMERPSERTETQIRVGGLVFMVATTPTTKRPSYAKVGEKFGNHLAELKDMYEKGRPENVITIDNQPFVATSYLAERITSYLSESLEGKEGISQSLELLAPAELLVEIPETVQIVLERDYSQPTEYNGRVYVGAANMKKLGDKKAERFKGVVLQDTLQVLGRDLEAPVAILYPFEHYNFLHQVEPRRVVKHGKVIEAFVKERPGKVTRRSRFGDLVKIEWMYSEEAEGFLREKGLIDDVFMDDYRSRRRGDLVYVKLDGVIKRLNRYRAEFVSPATEQNFSVVLR